MHRQLTLANLLILAVVLGPATGRAQGEPPDSPHRPFLAVALSEAPSAGFIDVSTGADVSVSERQLHAAFGQFTIGESQASFGIDYQYTRYEFEGIAGRNRDLHRMQFPLDFSRGMGQWRLEGVIAPGISTSSNVFKDLFNRGSSDDLYLDTRIVGRRVSDSRNWIVGLVYDRLFGDPTLYPVVGVEYAPTPALEVRVAFPDPSFRYQLSKRLTLSGRVFPAGHQWHVVTDDFTEDFDYGVEAFRAQSSLNVRTWKALSLDFAVGYEFARKHRFTDDTGTRIESRVDDQWFATLGFRLGPARMPYTHGGHL